MQENDDLRLIEEMCAHVGIQDAHEVVRTRHVVVDGTTVGLGKASEGRAGMPLFFDFGAMPHDGIERTLLEMNAAAGMREDECFAIDARTGSVVYRTVARVSAHEGGERLAECIQQSLERGREVLLAGMQGLVDEVVEVSA